MVLSLMIQIAKFHKSITFDVPGTSKAPRVSPVGKFLSSIQYLPESSG